MGPGRDSGEHVLVGRGGLEVQRFVNKKGGQANGLGREVNREEGRPGITGDGGHALAWPPGRHWEAPIGWYRDPA
jgi:hypothetical protein